MAHEHQRGDRDDYIDFQCQYLEGYEAARKRVMAPENLVAFQDFPTVEERMRVV